MINEAVVSQDAATSLCYPDTLVLYYAALSCNGSEQDNATCLYYPDTLVLYSAALSCNGRPALFSPLLTVLPPTPRPALIQRASRCQLYVFTIVSVGFICAPKPPFLTSPEGPP